MSGFRFPTIILMALMAAFAPATRAAGPAPDINQYTSRALKSLQVNSEIIQDNQDELKKIGGDFASVYRFHKVSLTYQQPGKLHVETVVLGAHIAYTINGNTRYTSVPTIHVHKIEDISRAPGKKQTLLDSGLLPPEQLVDYKVTFLRKEGALLVFQISPKQQGETFKDVFWMNPKTHITEKRLNYDRDGHLIKWFLYKNPVLVAPGLYLPTRLEVYNPQNKLAGVTVYSHIRVNQPIDQGIFNF